MGDKKTVHILMIGAHRTGKSSVLASMINSFQMVAENTGFHLDADKNTRLFIDSKLINLRDVVSEHMGQRRFTIDADPTSGQDAYTFTVSYQEKKQKQKVAMLVFHDIAGEDVGSDDTAALIQKSGVLLIAVDTVHLMEENGAYSSVFHKPSVIKNAIARAGFTADTKKMEPKMVLFVPLKCEKYYKEGRLQEVVEQIQGEKGFKSLIDYLKSPNFQDRITVAVTPILTMGAVAFDSFGRGEDGKVIRQQVQGQANLRPAQVFYKFIADTFSPKYCEQPVLYILGFVVASAQKVRKEAETAGKMIFDAIKRGVLIYLFGWLYLGIWLLMKSTTFKKDYTVLAGQLKKSGDGYKILQNPLNL